MTEAVLFTIVGCIAVFFAALMLVQDNAVYSALSLIVTMGCIAFLFLLLDAPFLAMIQITVYAGAIMVLFIFVMMLLGAEKLDVQASRFRWLTPSAVILSGVFLLVASLSVLTGAVDTQEAPDQAPLVRAINAGSDLPLVDVYAGDTLIGSGLRFRDASPFVNVPAGEQEIRLVQENGVVVTPVNLTLDPDTTQSVIIYGQGDQLQVVSVPTDLTAPDNRDEGRFAFFNAYPETTVSVYDLGVNGTLDTGAAGITDRLLLTDLQPGTLSEIMFFPEGTVNLAFVDANSQIVSRVVNSRMGASYDVERGTSQIVLLAAERSPIDESLVATTPVIVEMARVSFGGPEAVGYALFSTYLLPFQMVALLLLAAMVGAIVLTHRQEAPSRARAGRRRVSRPLTSVIASQVGHEVTGEDAPQLPPASQQPAGD